MIMLNVAQLLSSLRELDFRYCSACELLECYSQLNLAGTLISNTPDFEEREEILKEIKNFSEKIRHTLKEREMEHEILMDIASDNEEFYQEFLQNLPLKNLVDFYEEAKKLQQKDPEMAELANIIGEIMSERFLRSGGYAN